MTNPNHVEQRIEPQDGIGKSYDELVEMMTKDYWVVPINTDNQHFGQYWRVADVAQSGLVHYERKWARAEREESISALAEMTGIPYNTLAKYAREGRFPARKSGGVWLATRGAVEAAGIRARHQAPADEGGGEE